MNPQTIRRIPDRLICLALLLALITTAPADATWTGAVSHDWGDPDNWADLTAPSGQVTFGEITTSNFEVRNVANAGKLTFAADANGVLHIDIAADISDCLAVIGDFNLAAGATLSIASDDAPTAATYTIATWTGSSDGQRFDQVEGLPEDFVVRYFDNKIQLVSNSLTTLIIIQ